MITDNFPVEQFLARSKQAPLSVLAKFGPRFQDLFARVLFEFTRLHILRIICPPWSIATICENISGVAPLLETIDIHGPNSYGYDAHPSAFLPHFLPNRLPRLRTLHVSNIRFVWDNPIFTATLTKLVISGLGYTSSRHYLGSLDIFLDALERMSSLQVLNLYQGVIPSPPSHFRRKVALPSLASLKLVVAADDSYRLLEHVMLPTATRYQIIGAEGAIRIEDLVVALRNHFSDPTPLRALCLRRDFAGYSHLKGWRDAPNPVAQSSNNSLPRAVNLELQLLIDAPLLTSLLRGPGILSNVSVLEVRMRGRDWRWKDVFAGMPKIRVLAVYYDQHNDFLQALSAKYRTPSTRQRSPVIPNLQKLKLARMRLCTPDYDMEVEFLDDLLDTLVKRRDYGVPLQQLYLVRCVNIDAEDANRLADVVPEVIWDGVEQWVESEEEESSGEECSEDSEEDEENEDDEDGTEDEEEEEDDENEQYDFYHGFDQDPLEDY